jgi:hypothetical protein
MIVTIIVLDTNAAIIMDTRLDIVRPQTVTIIRIIFRTGMTHTAQEFTMVNTPDTMPATGTGAEDSIIIAGGSSSGVLEHARSESERI